jgi:hypothetical protein
MAEPKTKLTSRPAEDFLAGIEDARVREDCAAIASMMERATGAKARMWGSNIVGFGTYTMRYANGREGTWTLTAFAPRKRNITLYLMSGFAEFDALLEKLGKHSRGKSCLYINRLADVHAPTLEKLIKASVKAMKRKYPTASRGS